MTIENILRRKGTDVTTIAPEASIKRAADWLRAKNIGALVVTRENAVLGLISEREIVRAFSRYGETAGSILVKEIMHHGVPTVSPDDSINRVMNLMTHHRAIETRMSDPMAVSRRASIVASPGRCASLQSSSKHLFSLGFAGGRTRN